jgi:hypothetical protein
MSGPRYHDMLTSGALDKPRINAATLRADIAEIEQREAPDAGQVLLEIDRTKRGEGPERLQVALKEYEGHQYLDLRIWWRKENGAWLPSKRGITIRARELADVMRVLADAGRLLGGQQP